MKTFTVVMQYQDNDQPFVDVVYAPSPEVAKWQLETESLKALVVFEETPDVGWIKT